METAERIPLESIESSNLAALGYHPDKQILAVQFKSGAIFHYTGIALVTIAALYGAASRGSYFAQHIKGKYHGGKMTGRCPNCESDHGWIGETCADCGTAVYSDVPRRTE